MKVVRFSERTEFGYSGDFLSVDGVVFESREVFRRELARAEQISPKQPSRAIRPMFRTGSEYGAEIMKLMEA